MTQDDDELHQLASAIAEGAKVDWESTESGAADESIRPVIRELAVIAAISDVHSSVPLAGEPLDATSAADSFPEMLATWGTFPPAGKSG